MTRSHALLGGLLFASAVFPALAVDDGQGRDWRRLNETQSAISRPSWEQVAAVCPTDGVSACTGRLGSLSMRKWVWATKPQVLNLFAIYAPAILTSPTESVGSFELQAAAAQFQGLFGVTASFRGCPTYQPCFNSSFSTGMTATANTIVAPAVPWGGEVAVDLENGGGSFRLFTPLHPDMGRGLWMWRPTGLNTDNVYANDDEATLPLPGGGVAVADVLANDWVAGARATLANVTLEQITSAVAGVWLDTTTGSVQVASGTAAGSYSFDYRICNRANVARCDVATITVTIKTFALVARPDFGQLAIAQGGTAIANVLANDSIGSAMPNSDTVMLSQVSSTNPGVVLNTSTGAVQVAAGTANGTHVLTYRICERANPTNCAQSTATVSPHVIDAVNDSARGSSKVANTPLASVLANDYFRGARATIADVDLTLVSITPANPQIVLNTSTGAVSVTGKTASGLYQIVYRICERASPANCDSATVSLDLSGR